MVTFFAFLVLFSLFIAAFTGAVGYKYLMEQAKFSIVAFHFSLCAINLFFAAYNFSTLVDVIRVLG